MAEIGRWNGHKFLVSPSLIMGFTGLQIKASIDTEEKKNNKERYVARKNGNPSEVSFTIHLNALTGCNVRSEAMAFVSNAYWGKSDYFYVGSKKLLAYKLMLTEATVREIQIASNGTWIHADVQVTMKQCSKTDSSKKATSSKSTKSGGSSSKKSSSSKSTSKKASVKKSTTTKAKAPQVWQSSSQAYDEAYRDKLAQRLGVSTNKSSSALSTVKKTTSASKKTTSSSSSSSHKSLIHDQYVKKAASSAKKTTTTAKKATAAKKSTTKKTTSSSSAKRGSANRK